MSEPFFPTVRSPAYAPVQPAAYAVSGITSEESTGGGGGGEASLTRTQAGLTTYWDATGRPFSTGAAAWSNKGFNAANLSTAGRLLYDDESGTDWACVVDMSASSATYWYVQGVAQTNIDGRWFGVGIGTTAAEPGQELFCTAAEVGGDEDIWLLRRRNASQSIVASTKGVTNKVSGTDYRLTFYSAAASTALRDTAGYDFLDDVTHTSTGWDKILGGERPAFTGPNGTNGLVVAARTCWAVGGAGSSVRFAEVTGVTSGDVVRVTTSTGGVLAASTAASASVLLDMLTVPLSNSSGTATPGTAAQIRLVRAGSTLASITPGDQSTAFPVAGVMPRDVFGFSSA